MDTAVVRTDGLGKRYRSRWALRECSLRIDAGSIVALVGPNGAGKSTLLGMLTGLVKPTEGVLRVFGQPVTGEVRARVSFTAQEHPLYRQFTVADMIRAGRGLNKHWDDDGAYARLAALGIPPDRKVAALSGGQRAQVSLALALAKRPRLLLLDEPVAALDPVARQEFMHTMLAVAAERELTVILSSHVVAELARVCTHLIALRCGRVRIAGPVSQLLAEHLLVTGPAEAGAALRHTHAVVASTTMEGRTSAVIRRGPQPPGPVWRFEVPSIEQLVLGYLGHGETDPPPAAGPVDTEVPA